MTNKSTFAVQLPTIAQDKNGYYKSQFVKNITTKYPWLTIAGMDAPFTLKSGRELRGIEYAGPTELLTFGTAKNHDINWVKDPNYACGKGYNPVYNLLKDWNKIESELAAFAAARKPAPKYVTRETGSSFYTGGQKVEVFDNFFKIGLNIIPRTKANSNVYTSAQLETIKTLVITIKNLY